MPNPFQPFNLAQLVEETLMPKPQVFGPLSEGAYVTVGLGMGFYVPQLAFDECQRVANETRKTQFLTVDSAGNPIHGSRDECLMKGCGGVAWITPE